MWIIALKEFRDFLYNPKFLLTFAVSTVLILISIYNGYTVYESERRSAVLGEATALAEIEELENYGDLRRGGYRVSRFPAKLSIFDMGISGVVGRKSTVRSAEVPRLRDSRYSLDPVMAVFGELDLTFIVSFILSIFALLFSYNAISGEREAGTLRMIMANATSRSSVIIGKLIGGYIPFAILFLLPFLIGLAGLHLMTGINFTTGEWMRIVFLTLAILLYLLTFFSIGLAMSALTKNTFVSFLLCLFVWVLSTAIVPRFAVQAAAQVSPSMSIDEFESRLRSYQRSRADRMNRVLTRYFQEHPITYEEYLDRSQEIWNWVGDRVQEEREEFQNELFSEFRRKRNKLLQTATGFARVSPTSNLSFAIHSLTNTGPAMIDLFERDLLYYRRSFVDYAELMLKRQTDIGLRRRGGGRAVTDSDGYILRFESLSEDVEKIDLSGMPRFVANPPTLVMTTRDALAFITILVIFSIAFVALAFVAFLRYDVR